MDNYKKYFSKVIQLNFPGAFQQIINETNDHFNSILPDIQFAAASKNPVDRRLDFCGYFLALIQTLDKRGLSFESIRIICLAVVTDYVSPKNKFQAWLKRLPAKLVNTSIATFFLKRLAKSVRTNSNKDGFIAIILTDKEETYGQGYGIDILECGICKLFKKHRYEKYASILCEVDEITSGMAGLQLIRTGTIANGAKKCDFRFKKLK